MTHAYGHWKHDWAMELAAERRMSAEQRAAAEVRARVLPTAFERVYILTHTFCSPYVHRSVKAAMQLTQSSKLPTTTCVKNLPKLWQL